MIRKLVLGLSCLSLVSPCFAGQQNPNNLNNPTVDWRDGNPNDAGEKDPVVRETRDKIGKEVVKTVTIYIVKEIIKGAIKGQINGN